MDFNENETVATAVSDDDMSSVGDEDQPTTDEEPLAVATVAVPDGIEPGEVFQTYAGGRLVRVTCPPDKKAGESFELTVRLPEESLTGEITVATLVVHPPSKLPYCSYEVAVPNGIKEGQQFPITVEGKQQVWVNCPLGARPGGKVRIQLPQPPAPSNGPDIYQMKLPKGVKGGERFQTTIRGRLIMVRCPPNAFAGMTVRIQVPPPSTTQEEEEHPAQLYEVVVPPGIQVGQTFFIAAAGLRVALTCPKGVTEEKRRVRFKLPVRGLERHGFASRIQHLFREKTWLRTFVSTSDGWSYKWMMENGKGVAVDESDLPTRFDMDSSAYVRQLEQDGASPPSLTLVPAGDVSFCTGIRSGSGARVVSLSEIASAQLLSSAEDKGKWLREKYISHLLLEGRLRICVRGENLLEDSVEAVMSMEKRDLRKAWQIFLAGGRSAFSDSPFRWFELVSEKLLDPDMGLWMLIETGQSAADINPSADASEKNLRYFRCLGRLLGKALVAGEYVAQRSMARYIFKHLLGWPVVFADLELADAEYYNNLKQTQRLVDSGEDVSMLCLDFAVTQKDSDGNLDEVELVEAGKDVEVTNDNIPEYLEACLKYRMMERIKPQLTELLLGFFDVVPQPLMSIFSPEELELLLCGRPDIDIEFWKKQTDYCGEFGELESDHPVCKWFWEIVEKDFSPEMQSLALQFITGTNRPPRRVAGALLLDGTIRRFQLYGATKGAFPFPRAHTSFHRVDIPIYDTKDELRQKLGISITTSTNPIGFDID